MKDKITIVSIARDLGIAPSTVSRAFDPSSRISEPVREKILKYAESVGYVPNRAAARLSMGQIKVGVAISTHYSYGTDELLRGIKDAFDSLKDYKLTLKVVLYDNEKNSKNQYADVFKPLSDCDCLLLAGFNSDRAAEIINSIAEHTPVAMLQSHVDGVNPLFFSTLDTASATVMAADVLSLALRSCPQKRVALFTGNRIYQTHAIAEREFRCACSRLGLDIIFDCDMEDSDSHLARLCDQMPEVDGIYITSGKSLELLKRISKMEHKPVLITFDIYPELGAYMENGTVNATVYQDMYNQGHNAFTLLVRYIVDRALPPKVYMPTPQLVLPSVFKSYISPALDKSQLDILQL